jgi:uncharacterized membrane protein YkvA (DUF1232 family)
MPLDITFTLSDPDLDHFQEIVAKAKSAMEGVQDSDQILSAARQLITDAKSTELPEFIAARLTKLQTVIDMAEDSEWKLSDDERKRVIGALIYFCDPEDLIPDHIPGLGFLDDAIYVEIVIRELKAEIDSYEEFCKFRSAEEIRRKEQGLDPFVDREDWLADKRANLHAQMRKRRRSRASGSGISGGWRLRW